MNFSMCYLEVFDEETNQWEYVAKSNEPEEINNWYNNLETFFDDFNLFWLMVAIENEGQHPLFIKYKGLPVDCSKAVGYSYDFYFEEVSICQNASFVKLNDLFAFDYNQIINLTMISKKDLKRFYPEIYKRKEEVITHKEMLSEDYFTELYKTKQRFAKYPNCRCIYFVYEIDLD